MKIYDILQKNYDKMNKNDLKLYSFVVQNKDRIGSMSIEECSELAGVKTSSIMSFAKKMELDGFSELKYLVKWDENEFISFNDREIDYTFNDINLTMTMIKNQNLDQLFYKIERARNLYVIPSGYTQRNVAQELKKNFLNLEKQIITLDLTNDYDYFLDIFSEEDLFFVISFSGENEKIIDFINSLKNKPTIASITKLSNNSISYLSDFNIPFITHEVYEDRRGINMSPLSQFYVIIEFLTLKYMVYKNTNLENKSR